MRYNLWLFEGNPLGVGFKFKHLLHYDTLQLISDKASSDGIDVECKGKKGMRSYSGKRQILLGNSVNYPINAIRG